MRRLLFSLKAGVERLPIAKHKVGTVQRLGAGRETRAVGHDRHGGDGEQRESRALSTLTGPGRGLAWGDGQRWRCALERRLMAGDLSG